MRVCVGVCVCTSTIPDFRELQGKLTLETCPPLNKVKRRKLCPTKRQFVFKHHASIQATHKLCLHVRM